MRYIATLKKTAAAVVLAFFGLVACFHDQWPHYRTVEVSPGVFEERGMSAGELWIGVAVGLGLLALSSYLFWSAYRGFRHGPNAT